MAKSSPNHPSKTQQKLAFRPLTIEQENAIDLLILGKSDREVADVIGVNRMTVQQWRTSPAVFMAELNRRRQALWAEAHERLRALVAKAIAVFEEALDGSDVRAAIEVLKAVKLYGEIGAPQGPVEPDAVIRQLVRCAARDSVNSATSAACSRGWRTAPIMPAWKRSKPRSGTPMSTHEGVTS